MCGRSRTFSTAPGGWTRRRRRRSAFSACRSKSKGGRRGRSRWISHLKATSQLQSDQAFLTIIAAFLAQAIQINRMVMRQKEELLEENAQLRAQVRDRYRFENIIGDSPAMHEVFATVGQVANSRATVLLLGETGTGKEMIAKAIHYN